MYSQSIKDKAKELRRSGRTYSEIRKELDIRIPKNTLSSWCSNIELSKRHKKRIKEIILNNSKKARIVALAVNKRNRDEFLKQLSDRNLNLLEKIDKQVLKMLLAMLYVCEGSKWRSHKGLYFGNTNPAMIKFYIRALQICYPKIIDSNNAFSCWINHRADQNLSQLKKFWVKSTGIPIENFHDSKPDPRTKGKRTKKKDYNGVCLISSRSTEIQLELEILASLIFNYNGPLA